MFRGTFMPRDHGRTFQHIESGELGALVYENHERGVLVTPTGKHPVTFDEVYRAFREEVKSSTPD